MKLTIDPRYPLCPDSLAFLQLFDEPGGSKILAIGNNDECSAHVLHDNGYPVTGIDLRPWNVPAFPPKYDRIQTEFVKWAMLAYVDGSFDCIYSLSTIEHFGLCYQDDGGPSGVVYDQIAISWIWKLLREGGTCYLTVPYGKDARTDAHWRVYNKNSLQRLVTGFKIEEKRFFLSSECNCPSLDGFWVEESDANQYSGEPPHVAVYLKLRKE